VSARIASHLGGWFHLRLDLHLHRGSQARLTLCHLVDDFEAVFVEFRSFSGLYTATSLPNTFLLDIGVLLRRRFTAPDTATSLAVVFSHRPFLVAAAKTVDGCTKTSTRAVSLWPCRQRSESSRVSSASAETDRPTRWRADLGTNPASANRTASGRADDDVGGIQER